MSQNYCLSFVRKGQAPIYYVRGRDNEEWSQNPKGVIIYTDFSDIMRRIDSLREDYHDPENTLKKLIGTVRTDDESHGIDVWDTDSLISAMIATTPFGQVITAEGELTTNEVQIKAVMHTSY